MSNRRLKNIWLTINCIIIPAINTACIISIILTVYFQDNESSILIYQHGYLEGAQNTIESIREENNFVENLKIDSLEMRLY